MGMEHARIGYEAYIAHSGGKNYRGDPCPAWDELPEAIRGHWEAATNACCEHFENAATMGARFDFAFALRAVKAGHRVQRAGWNGKGMWVALTVGSVIPATLARNGAAEHLAAELDHAPGRELARLKFGEPPALALTILPHLDMRAADGSLVVGWLASQTDILAEDGAVL